uniref:tRNA nucleotidyltransferase/poly(A) polymerase RNA and SrmB- binding domain-containing protein n=1 Tax=Arundo donax TaxID=35708 RepID=A0A0A9GLG1_ARUDO
MHFTLNSWDHLSIFMLLCHCEGIDDLKKGLIVTPLPAKATFLDDPLRVLRAIRFAARFNFTLFDELKEAASDEKVKLELGCKISRERVGQEINLMMSGKHPVEAMSYIRDLGLFCVVFAFPETSDPPGVVFHTLKQLGTLQFLCTAAFLIPCCWMNSNSFTSIVHSFFHSERCSTWIKNLRRFLSLAILFRSH